jgi:hypothetical protein
MKYIAFGKRRGGGSGPYLITHVQREDFKILISDRKKKKK